MTAFFRFRKIFFRLLDPFDHPDKVAEVQRKLKYKVNIPLVLVGVLAFGGITQLALEKRVLSNYFGNIAIAYEDYGYPYCLATTIFNTGISAPRDYSKSEIKRIEKSE